MSDLLAIFQEINATHFDCFLEPPVLRWNARLRSSAGRFVPGSRKPWGGYSRPPAIEIAGFVRELDAELKDTIGHEMIHYWLWCRGQPYGHTPEFYRKMKAMGVSRFHTLITGKSPRHVYKCPECAKEFRMKRRIIKKGLACKGCCEKLADGKYHPRFKLVYVSQLPLVGCG